MTQISKKTLISWRGIFHRGWLSGFGPLFVSGNLLAGNVNLAWDGLSGNATGYMLYYGQSSRHYDARVEVGNSTSYSMPGLPTGARYYFAVSAYDSADYTESRYSDEVTAIVPDSQSIRFGVAPTLNVGDTGTLSATGGASGNPVTLISQNPGVCTISGWAVTGRAAGTCTIIANQAGNANYNAAPQSALNFTVSWGSQMKAAIECLFNWAERNYPSLFSPAGAKTSTWSGYTYRYYSGTNAYVGVSSANNDVYYLGQDGVLQDEGTLSYWVAQAGCQ